MIYLFIISAMYFAVSGVFLFVERCFMLAPFAPFISPALRFSRDSMFMPKKEDNARVEFNRGFYLAPCFESINSKKTLLIDIIDSNNVPLCILWLYRLECSLEAYKRHQPIRYRSEKLPELMKKFLIN